jgi:urocanate hydratase
MMNLTHEQRTELLRVLGPLACTRQNPCGVVIQVDPANARRPFRLCEDWCGEVAETFEDLLAAAHQWREDCEVVT